VAARENDKPELESRYSGFLLKMGVGHDVFQVIKEAIEMANKNQVKTFLDVDKEKPIFTIDEISHLIAHVDAIKSNRQEA
jgi:sugar/nucleoside kinase (ribokinase family)